LLLAVLELEAKALALPSMSDTRMLDEYATEAFAEALGR
jgi:hypothetical protein